jgi:hypothetical protein
MARNPGRSPRKYGLFERQANGSWKRLQSDIALPINKARQWWQNALLAHVFSGGPERRLMPVKTLNENPLLMVVTNPKRYGKNPVDIQYDPKTNTYDVIRSNPPKDLAAEGFS